MSCALLGCERKAELVERWGPQTFGLAVCDEQEREAQRLAYLMRRLNSTPLRYSASLENHLTPHNFEVRSS